MKVVIIHTDFRIYWPSRLNAIQQYLNSKNIELHIVEIAGKGSPYAFAKHNSNNYCKNWSILFEDDDIKSLKSSKIKEKVNRKLDSIQPDVVIAGAIAFYSGALSVAWTKRHGKKVILFDDARIEDVPRNKMINYVKKKIYSAVDAVIYPSQDWLQTAEYWGFNKQQLFVGVDVVNNDFWKEKEGKYKKEKKLLFVGRLIPRKNIILLIKLFDQISDKKGTKLVIIGDGEQKEEVMNTISHTSDIEYFAFMQQDELKVMYAKSSALIIPSTYDTWGLVINEAMASGLPVWASDKCRAAKILIKDRVNGFIFDPLNENSIKQALFEFINTDMEVLRQMGKESEQIISHWNLSLLAEEVYKAIEYVTVTEHRKIDLLTNLFLKFWRGRYNQK